MAGRTRLPTRGGPAASESRRLRRLASLDVSPVLRPCFRFRICLVAGALVLGLPLKLVQLLDLPCSAPILLLVPAVTCLTCAATPPLSVVSMIQMDASTLSRSLWWTLCLQHILPQPAMQIPLGPLQQRPLGLITLLSRS